MLNAVGARQVGGVRVVVTVSFVIAAGVALYTGFRVPNDWTATLDAVSVTEGFHRRFLVGTLLSPLAALTKDDYWLFAATSFAVLAALVTVAGVALWRAELISQQALVVAFFLLPTGGFLFNEVGYYEQVLYLALFLAIWLVNRDHPVIAAAIMAAVVFVHEMAILSVLPVFALIALRRLGCRRALGAVLPAVALNGVILLVPSAATDAVSRLGAQLSRANFPYRVDALALFNRTLTQNWQLYSVVHVLVYLVPLALFLIGIFLLLRSTDRSPASIIDTTVSVLAIGAPVALAFAGWDTQRWELILVANFFLVLWANLERSREELSPPQIAVLVAALLIVAHVPVYFFDSTQPRAMDWPDFKLLVRQVMDGALFRIPPV